MGKNFELMDLKLSKKLEIVTKMCINQPIWKQINNLMIFYIKRLIKHK